MEKTYAEYMKWGKLVKNVATGKIYKLVEDMNGEKDDVRVVSMNNLDRYNLLHAWVRNWEQNSMGFRESFTGNIEDCKVEVQGYEEYVNITDIEPHNTIRFITSNYQDKFRVKDLSDILMDGNVRKVVYLDETHFTFTVGSGGFGCFHICQYAELCEKNGIEVLPIESETKN